MTRFGGKFHIRHLHGVSIWVEALPQKINHKTSIDLWLRIEFIMRFHPTLTDAAVPLPATTQNGRYSH